MSYTGEKAREYARRYYQENKERIQQHRKEYAREYYRRNYLKIGGHSIRVHGGKRPRPDDSCEVCGGDTKLLSYHHWDDKHLDWGVWVCNACHRIAEVVDRGSNIADLKETYLALKQSIQVGMALKKS